MSVDDLVTCPVCRRRITREEMDEEIRTGTKTLVIHDGRLCHKDCLAHPLSLILIAQGG